MHPTIRRLLLVVLGVASCRGASDLDTGSSVGDSSVGGSSTGATTVVTASTSSSTATTTDDPARTTSADSTGMLFLPHPDGGPHFECDIFAQDCPAGEKCTNWAFDGGLDWNGTKCVPVVDEPAGSGEPCHVEGSPTSGVDDCDSESMCFYIDPETLEGICTPFCTGQESDPQCDGPDQFCHIQADGALFLCLSKCNPLQQNCWSAGQGCYFVGIDWSCAADASGDMGGYGDPCEFINVCDPGLLCLDASTVPPGQPCEGAAGCCTEICDLSDPAGDLQCAGAADGQLCQPWYEAGAAPAGYENVGACALPA